MVKFCEVVVVSFRSEFVWLCTHGVEVVVRVSWVIVERSHVTCLFVPMSVEVVSHDCYPVKMSAEGWHVVARVYDRFARRNSRGQQPASGFEDTAQFSHEGGESLFVGSWSFIAIHLNEWKMERTIFISTTCGLCSKLLLRHNFIWKKKRNKTNLDL